MGNTRQMLTSEKVDSDVAEYLALLDSQVNEGRVHEFLASHSYFFHMLLLDICYPYPLYSKIRLGSDYETDFASFISSSFGPEWRLAEIESPRTCSQPAEIPQRHSTTRSSRSETGLGGVR
jgi:hypothetical protein